MSLFLLQAGLVGGAYAAGRYPEWKKGQAAAEAAHKDYEKLRSDARQALLTTQARAVLMEAALAVRYGNYGMAFERVIRAQSAAQNLKMTALQKDFDELSALLIQQKPEVLDKILAIADKIEPPTKLVPTDSGATSTPAAMMVPSPSATAATTAPTSATTAPTSATTAPTAPTASGAAPSPAPGKPLALPAPTAAPSPALAATPSMPPRNASPDTTIEQGRSSLLGAKELLISGSEPAQVIAKIAHAQVILEEGGHAELAEQFATAIKALRAHDEPKARTSLDALLTNLRTL